LQHSVGITFVVVTHDQEEALALADRVAVMKAGRILQVGPAEELFERPEALSVATALGEANVLRGRVQLEDGRPVLRSASWQLPLDPRTVDHLGLAPDDPAAIVIRPERTLVTRRDAPATASLPRAGDVSGAPALAGVVGETIYLGGSHKVAVELLDGTQVVARVQGARAGELAPGVEVSVGCAPSDAILVVDHG
jgi:ABC-type Fe3+/spermidine/putrescine transport system ATPase subunit